jgi:hypothetical protein
VSAYERLARQALDTRYALADGTELRSSVTLMRTDLTNLAWAVIELEREHERRIRVIAELPPVVFASDDKEREMLSKGVVLRILRGRDTTPARAIPEREEGR